jgi:hypothetical protein
MALSELVTYIVETSLNSVGPSAFRLADMGNLYQQRLDQLGVHSPTVNSTRLKEKLLAVDHFSCPACMEDIAAISVDGNRKMYRFNRTKGYGYCIHLIPVKSQ